MSDPAATLISMSPDAPSQPALRSAEELNAAIRALWIGPGGHPSLRLTNEQREEYGRLLAELRQVERGDVTTAA